MKGKIGLKNLNSRSVTVLFVTVLLLLCLSGCVFSDTEPKSNINSTANKGTVVSDSGSDSVKTENTMRIKVSSDSAEVIFELNDSSVSKSFYNMLPISVSVENYSTNEKIFQMPEKPDVSKVWEGSCPTGTIAFFSPWNNVAMYYGDAPEYKGLYPMGTAVDGAEKIEELAGDITITAYIENK